MRRETFKFGDLVRFISYQIFEGIQRTMYMVPALSRFSLVLACFGNNRQGVDAVAWYRDKYLTCFWLIW